MGSLAKANILVVFVALSTCINMVLKGEAQIILTPLSCLRRANNVPGCLNAFKQALFHKNASGLTTDCCKLVNEINGICSLILFPTQPQGITILKGICSFVNSPPPAGSGNSATPPPQGSTTPPTPSGNSATPPPQGSTTPLIPSGNSATPTPSTSATPSPPTASSNAPSPSPPTGAAPPTSAAAAPPSN